MHSEVQSRTISVIAQPDHSFFDRALEVLFDKAEAAGLSIVCRPFNPTKGVLSFDENCLGYFVLSGKLLPIARQLQAAGKRVVLLGLTHEPAGVPNVCSDQEEGGYVVMRHLIELGHRHIVIQDGDPTVTLTVGPRLRGSQRALEEERQNGTRVRISYVDWDDLYGNWKRNPGVAHQFFTGPNAPTAVAAWNDDNAFVWLTFLNHVGLRVPQNVSLVGYDNLPQSANVFPALTTFETGMDRQLNTVLRLLTQPEMPDPNQSFFMLPSLAQRDSSARPTH